MDRSDPLDILQRMQRVIQSIARTYVRKYPGLEYADLVAEMQDAVLQALQRTDQSEVTFLQAYLERVAKRKAWTIAREAEEKRTLPFDENISIGEEASFEDIENVVVNRLMVEDLLSSLAPKHRELIVDVFFRGYSPSSAYMVEKYGRGSAERVQKKLHYVLKKLRNIAREKGYLDA